MTASPSIGPRELSGLARALPFWSSLILVPLSILAAVYGGWFIALVPIATWYLFTALDAVFGIDAGNADPQTPDGQLNWYRMITLVWVPVQFAIIFGGLWYITHTAHLSGFEEYLLFAVFGVVSGTIGINYSHELMHQKPKIERWMADILLAMVLYSHFRSEHLFYSKTIVRKPTLI